MSETRSKLPVLALICGLLFVAGLIQLLLLRFETGDVYPAYSSLRSDPLGTQVLFESIGQVSQFPSQRNYKALDQIDMDTQTTLVICGLMEHGRYLRHKFWQRLLDRLDQRGGRLVLAFTPDPSRKRPSASKKEVNDSGDPKSDGGNETEPIEEFVLDPEDLAPSMEDDEKWRGLKNLGLALQFANEKPASHTAIRIFITGVDQASPEIPWPTPLYFESLDVAWQTHYIWQGKPVIISRSWGRGTLFMVADSYLLSNEALSKQRQTGLLAWILRPENRIVFDETHHGLVQRPGIVSLARKYRLHGVFGAMILLTLLLIWRQAAVFVPPAADDPMSAASPAIGLNTQEGMVNLMRQHIDPKHLLEICFKVWRQSTAGRVSDSKISQIETIVRNSAGQDPGPTYRTICNLMKQGKDT